MSVTPLQVVCAVSRLTLDAAFYGGAAVWHASSAHHGHHTALGQSREEALAKLKSAIERRHGRAVELVVI
ncbi:MAG: hypothetical protein PVSMB1_04160 [Gemmatimonadaceae bacterium]